MNSFPPYMYDEPIVATEPASSVIPVRDGSDGSVEVYMTQRSDALNFLGGYYVFPGGKVDPQDFDEEAITHCRGVTPEKAKKLLHSALSPERCLAHWVAGIRELFEEAGVLLAYDRKKRLPDFNVRRVRRRMDNYRRLIQTEEIDMNLMMRRARLEYAADKLIYFSHWITPPGSNRRFDTRFFVAPVPQTQRPRFHQDEVQEGIWLKPREALDKASRREWPMIPPTIISLRTIARYNSVAELEIGL